MYPNTTFHNDLNHTYIYVWYLFKMHRIYRIAGNFHRWKFSRFKGKTVWYNFCDFYFRDFKWDNLWICVGINNCGFYFRDSVNRPRNRENKNPAKISRYTVAWIQPQMQQNYNTCVLVTYNSWYTLPFINKYPPRTMLIFLFRFEYFYCLQGLFL